MKIDDYDPILMLHVYLIELIYVECQRFCEKLFSLLEYAFECLSFVLVKQAEFTVDAKFVELRLEGIVMTTFLELALSTHIRSNAKSFIVIYTYTLNIEIIFEPISVVKIQFQCIAAKVIF